MDKLLFQEIIKVSNPGLHTCDECGAPLIVTQNNEFGWKYIDGFWKHDCKKKCKKRLLTLSKKVVE